MAHKLAGGSAKTAGVAPDLAGGAEYVESLDIDALDHETEQLEATVATLNLEHFPMFRNLRAPY